jgi:8-oxo-dGTP diphosphatase/2-hydroxy-dATP diphosphatase
MKLFTTLCLPIKNNQILLGLKKTRFGKGRWNGFGGKVQIGETIEQATKRELFEECKISATELTELGNLQFYYKHKQDTIETYIFQCNNFTGEPAISEEMEPRWFNFEEIPYEQMWPDDKFWLPIFLKNKKFVGHFIFRNYDDIERYELTILE